MKNNKKVFAIANQKGGVGKTTTAANLGNALQMKGKKVLLIDLDQQGNLSELCGIEDIDAIKNSLYELMRQVINEEEWDKSYYINAVKENLDLISSNVKLANMELDLVNTLSRESVLTLIIEEYVTEYDYILIDCPPSLGLLTLNAFAACDSVIIPVQAEYHSAVGVASLLTTIRKIARKINPEVEIEGILLTMYRERTKLSKEIYQMLNEAYGAHVKIFFNKIPFIIKVGEAAKEGKSIMDYAENSKAAVAYLAFCDELLAGDQYVPHVEIGALKRSKLRKSDDMNIAVLEQLIDEIKQNGVQTPIEVRELKNGTYEVINHFKLFNAAFLADQRTVPIRINNDLTDAELISYVHTAE